MRKNTLAYLAGIVDGEGAVGIIKIPVTTARGRINPQYKPYLAVHMIDRDALYVLCNTFGGRLCKQKARGNRRDYYKYDLCFNMAINALRKLSPFLLVKWRQAELVLELSSLQKTSRDNRLKSKGCALTKSFVKRCDLLYRDCRALNKRGRR